MSSGGKATEVGGIVISSPERIVFPRAGCTKLDIAKYYEAAAPRLLDLAGHRPLALVRCPDGVEGDCFFQKHAGSGFPEEIDRFDLKEATGKVSSYMVITRKEGFVAAAQMGTIEFHIWGSRTDRLERPDRMVFDLDPDQGLDFGAVRQAAVAIRELLGEIGLTSGALVTGGKGVHVIVPLKRTVDWEAVKTFARTVANYLAERQPEKFVATMSKEKRKGRLFIDWLRNERGQTAIAPYSVRNRPGATVAIPIEWDELDELETANRYAIADAFKRLEEPCPLSRLSHAQSLSQKTIDALDDRISAR